jgi:hypothetical protein
MTDAMKQAEQFFDRYAAALVARDEQAIAQLYAVPSLILFPGQALAVSDARQTAEFFAASWGQYEGVDQALPRITVMGAGPASIWADVSWSYGGDEVRERFCYQLVPAEYGHQIAVLTFMG